MTMARPRTATGGLCNIIGFSLITLFLISSVNSIVMPQTRLYSRSDKLQYDDDGGSQPYVVSINEGDAVDVMVKSRAAITVNLNQAIQQDISVLVKVFSGPNLISFDKPNTKAVNSTFGNSAEIVITFQANTFGDRIVEFHTNQAAGHAEIVCKVDKQPADIHIDDSSAFISVNISRNYQLTIIISAVGWLYFFAWSLSFYFQVILNYQRKSVVGLNFDFLALNLIGFICYSIYNFTFMFSREVRKIYYDRNAYTRIPVEYNDLFFALHAFALTLVTVIQCFLYERGQQRVSIPAGSFIGTVVALGIGLYIVELFNAITILDVVLYLSYIKLAITVIKYSPQAYMNYKRKATSGWSIHNILLDFTGGVLSLAQMFLLAYNYDDWISIFGNFTKFGLGIISISFDIVFVIQHYVLYKQVGELDVSTDSVPSPVISRSIRSSSYRQDD